MSDQKIFEAVRTVITQTLAESNRKANALTCETLLSETRLDSLDWAVVVVRLQDMFGIDPFELGMSGDLKTIGDFASLYHRGLSDNQAA